MELVDTQAWGACERNFVLVRVKSGAPNCEFATTFSFLSGCCQPMSEGWSYNFLKSESAELNDIWQTSCLTFVHCPQRVSSLLLMKNRALRELVKCLFIMQVKSSWREFLHSTPVETVIILLSSQCSWQLLSGSTKGRSAHFDCANVGSSPAPETILTIPRFVAVLVIDRGIFHMWGK